MGLSVRALSRPAVYCSANKAPVRSTSASLFCDLFSCSTFLQRLGDHRFGYFILHSIDEAVPQVSCSDMDVYGWPVTLLLASLLRSVADSQSCHAKGPFQRWRLSERPSRGWRLHLLGILRIPPSHRVLEQAPRFTVVEIKWTPLNY
ncbi:uncharacterized protein LOC122555686 isoform X2 [Chiloscyllium plagiosum]|uniref:uncharacterized protein LOC122555686 isoform X2 n=1 Tax=Chiloscyllium plagiosum TaxID=36176 RepID=UPI001CB7C994|nr:uncharacterized protein LOC122555686 isoform X2 [Chiloscyllium plagiosum]